ncbi:NUDIX hydrolase [Alicyclobacillus sp.]|uniref:NUDIX hydrolase n=1 Tax=Alicyclobacillus sp. TaxID=61169 RepID=UPI0025BEA560|nr:NUDIX hydrolase [Alicyclobacillus sp.]MCL6515780.1 NUDIX hydrolase [Alicyclobacillus sp.]
MDESLREEVLDRHRVFSGRMISLETWRVRLPDGREAGREVVLHPGAVAILAEAEPGVVLCVEQFRTATGETLLEIPAGKLEPGEEPGSCAKRELAEETGCTASHWEPVASFFTSPGFADEQVHLFYATQLTRGAAHPDADEFVRVRPVTRAEAEAWVRAGRVRDAKTLVAFLWWLARDGGDR